jgi:hypothetical protein
MQLKILLALTIFFASSCQGIIFDPDARFLRQDNETRQVYLLTEDGHRIYSDTSYFYDHACMSMDKWQELYELLQRSGNDKQLGKIQQVLNGL